MPGNSIKLNGVVGCGMMGAWHVDDALLLAAKMTKDVSMLLIVLLANDDEADKLNNSNNNSCS